MNPAADTPSDPAADLLARVAQGDRAAFRALYDIASAKLYGTVLRILGTRSEADDALQEVFIRIWRHAPRFDPRKGRGMTWMITIARNHAIDRLRARPPAAPAESDAIEALPAPGPDGEARVIAMGEAGRIADCLDALEPERASAVRGAYLDGLSYEQLARRHSVPLNTMRTWLRRSLIRLRECLSS